MELLSQLTKDEKEEYAKLRQCQNGTDEKTYNLALKYYLDYKKNTETVCLN